MPPNSAEAELRIEAAMRDNSAVLDLSELRLTSIPDDVAELSHLRELRLNDNWLREVPESIRGLAQLTHLDLADNQLLEVPTGSAGFVTSPG